MPLHDPNLRRFFRALAFALLLPFVGCKCFFSGETPSDEDVDLSADATNVTAVLSIPAPTNDTAQVQSGAQTNAAAARAKAKAAPILVYDCPSPNFDKRTLPISMIVLHYTAAPLRESLNMLRNGKRRDRVSCHYVVAENGEIYRLVDESKRAWHAGVSHWRDISDVNSASIGIEIVNLGHDRHGKPRPYPAKQIEAVIRLCLNIQGRHPIVDVVGHSDVAPQRKIDPGELFPWRMLAKRGVRVKTRGFAARTAIRRR